MSYGYYVIRDGSAVPSAVIERYRKSAKAFTHDLAWVPFDLSAGTAEECGFEDFKQHVHAIARHVPRAVVHLDGETERVFGRDLEWTTPGLVGGGRWTQALGGRRGHPGQRSHGGLSARPESARIQAAPRMGRRILVLSPAEAEAIMKRLG
jgi:hypothetical protein